MATRAFIIPIRNDLGGMSLQIVDLSPNTSQKNSIYDGEGQTGYVHFMMDRPGTTEVDDNAYADGSRTTSPLSATAAADADGNAANDSSVTGAADFGLLAYLRERVHVNPGGDSDFLTTAEALNIANDIISRVMSGLSLTASAITTLINARVAGADSDLTGDAANSDSFGSVEDILRILSGEVYRVKEGTIVGDETGAFMALAAREALADGVDYHAQGGFLTSGEAGYQDVRALALTGAIRGSAHEGRLSHLIESNTLTLLNPAYAYSAGAVRSWRERAVQLDGTVVPETGTATVLRVYDGDGNILT